MCVFGVYSGTLGGEGWRLWRGGGGGVEWVSMVGRLRVAWKIIYALVTFNKGAMVSIL